MQRAETGSSVIEVLVAAAIATLMALTGLAACKAVAATTAAIFTTGRDVATIDAQTTRLRDDAAAAFAVFVPERDAHGALNVVDGTAHEVDFYARTEAGADDLWRYVYDAPKQTLQRFDYAPGGIQGVRNRATGTIDTAAAYPALRGVTRFEVRALPADRLADPAVNPYGGAGALFARMPRALGISYDHPGLGVPGAVGGNGTVQIAIANANAARIVHLTPGTLPAGFTVTGLPRWHAIVYRVDQTHRFLFGFAGKSHVFINARIDVTYDGWTTRKVWCDFNLLGNPGGLDPHDPHADYTPGEPFEQADALLAACRRLHPAPPDRDAPPNPPEPGLVSAPAPGPAPPACWTAPGPGGRCWPPEAPIDWAPPSPLPPDPPPARWCATHAQSLACPAGSAPKPAAPGT